MNRHESRIFVPFKAVGLVCSSVAAVVRALPKRRTHTVLCAVGNVVHQYNAGNLRLISISDPLKGTIQCMAADSLYVYAAVGCEINVLHLSRQVKFVLRAGVLTSSIKLLLPFSDHLIVVDQSNALTLWDLGDQSVYLTLNFSADLFKISAICHPSTYLNKIMLGSDQGALKLVNVKDGKLISDFAGFGSSITVLEQSPAVDVLACGLEDGRIILHNFQFDETLFSLKQDTKVTALSFRTDGPEVLLSAGCRGDLAVWDLAKQRLLGLMTDSHKSEITTLTCIPNETIAISAGTDNALRSWIFDQPDGLGRELSVRDGHSGPGTSVKFHGQDGEWVVSASEDGTVRAFSVWKDTKQQNLGTAGIMSRSQAKRTHRDLDQIRIPSVVSMDCGAGREAAWDNVVCTHKQSPMVTTWTTRRKRLGTHHLLHPRFDSDLRLRNAYASCVCVSACGNFALIGYSTGHVDCYNVQSGIHRGSYNDPGLITDTDKIKRAHADVVTGACTDALNQVAITSCAGGRIKFWRFKEKSLLKALDVGVEVVCISLNRENSLLGVTLTNGSVGVVDVHCRRVVRRFNSAHTGKPIAVGFNHNGQWMVTADDSGYFKVWNLPTATLIDVLKLDDPCVSFSLSPSGEYLATCHTNQRGVYLWANKAVYSAVLSFKPLPFDYQPASTTCLPETGTQSNGNADDGTEKVEEVDEGYELGMDQEGEEQKEESRVQIASNLITLSGLPPARWAQLPEMDLIRLRNKPIEPPKKPKAAPFFLPTVSTLEGFSFEQTNDGDGDPELRTKVLVAKRSELEPHTKFGQQLLLADGADQRMHMFNALKDKGPASTDLEIRSLTGVNLTNFLKMLLEVAQTNRDFDLLQAYLGSFLKIHRDEVSSSENTEMTTLMRSLLCSTRGSWKELDSLLLDSLGTIQWLKAAAV